MRGAGKSRFRQNEIRKVFTMDKKKFGKVTLMEKLIY